MNYAVIDVGSHTIRLSVYRYEDGKLSTVISQKEVAGLAGYVKNDRLELEGIQKACDILRVFREIAVKFVEEKDINIFATATLRSVLNQDEVLEAIRLSSGLLPEVLPGEEEARLSFIGASHFAPYGDGLLIDIGGGSTELVRFENSQPAELVSMPIGCLNLYAKFVEGFMPTGKERKEIKKEIRSHFNNNIKWSVKERLPLMIGVGGTVRAVHKLSCDIFSLPREQREIPAGVIKEILDKLKNNEQNIYHTMYKQIPERVQTISTGLMILKEAVKHFKCETLFVSGYGLREGYLIDRVIRSK